MDFKLRMNARHFSDQELLADLREVARSLGTETVEQREYLAHGKFSCKPFINRFGSWNNAIRKAGLPNVRETNVADEMLFENMEKIWRELGRQPFYSEIRKPRSKYTIKLYLNRFGGWTNACKEFVRSKESDPEFTRIVRAKSAGRSRTINEKTRLQVFKRDNYACVICGRSPATHRGITLHLDHKTPFSKNGDNNPENLRTLCSKCNLAKGNDERL